MHNKLLHRFFLTIKLCCQLHVQVTSLFFKKALECLRKKQFFWICLYEKQLDLLRGYPTYGYVAEDEQNEMNKNKYKHMS